MKRNRTSRFFKKEDFEKVKKLCEIGVDTKDIKKILGWCEDVVVRAKRAKTYDEYQKQMQDKYKKHAKGSSTENGVVDANYIGIKHRNWLLCAEGLDFNQAQALKTGLEAFGLKCQYKIKELENEGEK